MFIFTEEIGTPNEHSYEVAEDDLLDVIDRILDGLYNGEAVQIRRAEYLDIKRPQAVVWHGTKTGRMHSPVPHLRLVEAIDCD